MACLVLISLLYVLKQRLIWRAECRAANEEYQRLVQLVKEGRQLEERQRRRRICEENRPPAAWYEGEETKPF